MLSSSQPAQFAAPAAPAGPKDQADPATDTPYLLIEQPPPVPTKGAAAPICERGIEIAGWRVMVARGPICSTLELESVERITHLPSLPEMLFGGNRVTLTHRSGFSLDFNALDAVKGVAHGDGDHYERLRVHVADAWQASRGQQELVTARPYDWTFTTAYSGTTSAQVHPFKLSNSEFMDAAVLRRAEPILFLDSVVLYEDELADHGQTTLSVHVRVMPTGILVLQRLFVRVDEVLFRMRDTRVYCDFSRGAVLRETCWREMTHGAVRAGLAGAAVSSLADPQWVSERMVPRQPFAAAGDGMPPEYDSSGAAVWADGSLEVALPAAFRASVPVWAKQGVRFSIRREIASLTASASLGPARED